MRTVILALLVALCLAVYSIAMANVSFCGTANGTKCNHDCARCAAASAATMSADDEEEVVMTYTTTLSKAEVQAIKQREVNATAIADDEANTLSAQVQLAEGMCRSNCAWIKYVLHPLFHFLCAYNVIFFFCF